MYGRSDNSIVMNPPTIVVFSNETLSANLSVDRWESYEILENNDWKDITNKVQNEAKKIIHLNNVLKEQNKELLVTKVKRRERIIKKYQEA